MKKVMTIAGSDSGGGAGIQADLKTFSAFGVFGMCVITAVTAQNTLGVQDVFTLPEDVVGMQLTSVLSDIGADAIKIGMVANSGIITSITKILKEYEKIPIVLDPVLASTSGKTLLDTASKKVLINTLIPLAFVLTPNVDEASEITGLEIKNIKQMKQAAKNLYEMGPKNVLIKGGHLPQRMDAIDILYDGKSFSEFRTKRINSKNTHGTGCTFSSAIACGLAKQYTVERAIKQAKQYLTRALQSAKDLHIGHGHGPLNHLV